MEQIKKIFTQMQNKLINNVENLSAYIIETDNISNSNMPKKENCNEDENDNILMSNDVNVVKKKSNLKRYMLFIILFTIFVCIAVNVYDNGLDDKTTTKQDGGFELRNEILNIDLST